MDSPTDSDSNQLSHRKLEWIGMFFLAMVMNFYPLFFIFKANYAFPKYVRPSVRPGLSLNDAICQ